MDCLGLIPLFVLGLAMIIKPGCLWEVKHTFVVGDVGPTGLYLTFIRVSGIFFMICSVTTAFCVLLP